MNNKIDLKKVGLIVLAIVSIVITLSTIVMVIEQGGMYGPGAGMYLLSLGMIDITCLAVAYYFSTKKIMGPIIGLIYAIFGMTIGGVSIFYLILTVGYVLVLIHYINENNLKQESSLVDLETSKEIN